MEAYVIRLIQLNPLLWWESNPHPMIVVVSLGFLLWFKQQVFKLLRHFTWAYESSDLLFTKVQRPSPISLTVRIEPTVTHFYA